MASPISNENITSQTREQSRTSKQEVTSTPDHTAAEDEQNSSSSASSSVQVSDTGKLLSQSSGRSADANRINSHEQALAVAGEIKSSFAENSSAALSTHSMQADQLAGLLQSAPA